MQILNNSSNLVKQVKDYIYFDQLGTLNENQLNEDIQTQTQAPKRVHGNSNAQTMPAHKFDNLALKNFKTETIFNDQPQFQQQKQELQTNRAPQGQTNVERQPQDFTVQVQQQQSQTQGINLMKSSVYTNTNNTVIVITNNTKYAIDLVALYLEKINISNYELLTVPGGIFGLYNNQFWENYVLKSIEIMKLREIPKIILLISVLSDYSNDKMYGQSNDIEDQRRIANSIRRNLQMNLIATPIFHGILLKDEKGQYERLF